MKTTLRNGKPQRGSNHPCAILTDDNVRHIRVAFALLGAERLARRYGITASAIYLIKNRKRWSHVK